MALNLPGFELHSAISNSWPKADSWHLPWPCLHCYSQASTGLGCTLRRQGAKGGSQQDVPERQSRRAAIARAANGQAIGQADGSLAQGLGADPQMLRCDRMVQVVCGEHDLRACRRARLMMRTKLNAFFSNEVGGELGVQKAT